HSDSLQVLVRHGEEELLIDPGTYTSVADPAWRNRFRGSAAHNTVRVDGKDQAAPAGPFFWCGKPRVKIRQWASEPDQDFLDAECRSDGIVHRRRILLLKPAWLVVLDEIAGPDGEHVVEQFWHCGEPVEELSERRFRIGNQSCLILASGGMRAGRGSRLALPCFRPEDPSPGHSGERSHQSAGASGRGAGCLRQSRSGTVQTGRDAKRSILDSG